MQGEQLTTYSFRHRYAKEMPYQRTFLSPISAEAMGHTMEVHLEELRQVQTQSGTADHLSPR